MKPRIGITAGMTADGRYFLQRRYCDEVKKAGGEPFILVPTDDPAVSLSLCGGIIFSGGGDISPSLCGITEYDPIYLDAPSPERDRYELELAVLAYENNTPCFGICRGIQIMNVALGGTLHFHIDGHMQKRDKDQPSHSVCIERGSLLSQLVGTDTVEVNSLHHQAANITAHALTVTARSEDGHTEAVEARDRRFFLGVQWHPEYLTSRSSDVLFAALCTAASQK